MMRREFTAPFDGLRTIGNAKYAKKRSDRGVFRYGCVHPEEQPIYFTTKDTKSTKFKNSIAETFVSFVCSLYGCLSSR